MNKLVFTEEDLPQKSSAWLDKRTKHIGGSDMAILTGDLPSFFDTAFDLFERKIGKKPPKVMNAAMMRGAGMEDEARLYIERHLRDVFNIKASFEPLVAVHPHCEALMVSFDGVDIKNKIFAEIKCQSEKNFTKTIKTGMPSYYKAQVQSQASVANAHWGVTDGFFCSYYPEPVEISMTEELDGIKTKSKITTQLACIPVQHDAEYSKYLHKLATSFQAMVDAKEWNPYWDL